MANNHGSHEGGHFIVPFNVLRNVAVALLVLTFLTVAAAQVNLGPFGPLVAFAIAIVKALLVMAFFMGLKYDVKGNSIIFSLGFLFLGLLFILSAIDIWTRIGQISTL